MGLSPPPGTWSAYTGGAVGISDTPALLDVGPFECDGLHTEWDACLGQHGFDPRPRAPALSSEPTRGRTWSNLGMWLKIFLSPPAGLWSIFSSEPTWGEDKALRSQDPSQLARLTPASTRSPLLIPIHDRLVYTHTHHAHTLHRRHQHEHKHHGGGGSLPCSRPRGS
jgi:hypothetical protein